MRSTRMLALGASLLVLLINWPLRGEILNYGNDFKGGSEVQVEGRRALLAPATRAALRKRARRVVARPAT